ncbi:hypothetical protein D3C72_1498480 [compost metagenome]
MGIRRVAKANGGHLRLEALEKCAIDRSLHENAGAADAGLSGTDKGGERRTIDRALQIEVVEHDCGTLAAQLERRHGEAARRRFADGAPDFRASCKDDFPHQRMAGQRRAGFTSHTVHHIHHAVWHARLAQQTHEPHGGERGLLGRLDHHAVARGQSGREALGQDHQRVVERCHQGDHAERYALRVAEIRTFDRNDVTAARECERGEISVELRQACDLRARLVDRPAVVERFELIEVFEVRLEQVRESIEHARPLRDRHVAPHPALERRMPRADRAVHIV